MSLEDTVYATLANDGDVGPLVLDSGIYQIFKGTPPQGYPTAKPYIVLTVVFGERPARMDGLTGEKHKNIQVDCFDTDQDGARTLADHVYDALGSLKIGASSEQYRYEEDTELHRYILEFSLWVNS